MARNGSPSPIVYATRRIAPWATVVLVEAIVRIPPRITPMHGVQPTAKIAPSPKDASQPPRLPTSRPPSRSPNVGADPLPNDIVPVVAATDADAPASSGRQVRSSAGMRRTPARLSPRMTRITPPTWRRNGIHCDSPAAANVAVIPSSVKTAPNPATYARAWRKATQRVATAGPPSAATAEP